MHLLDFHQVIWLLPIAAFVHVMEELPRFPDWATRTLKAFQAGPAATMRRATYTRSKFIGENIVLFAILTTSVTLAAFLPETTLAGKVGIVLVLSAAVGFFSNMLFHGLFTLKTGVYSPGTVTACLFFAPLSICVYYLAAVEGLLTLPVVGLSVVLGLSLLPIVVSVVHRVIDRKTRPGTLVKVALMGVLPPVLIGVATAVFDAAIVHKIMIYAGPLALLPLVLKWARRRTDETKGRGTELAGGDR